MRILAKVIFELLIKKSLAAALFPAISQFLEHVLMEHAESRKITNFLSFKVSLR